jgi:hypothetical protein
MTGPSELDQLSGELERAAERLRSGELDGTAAAELVDECARLAARAAAELDREARASEPGPGQDSLI